MAWIDEGQFITTRLLRTKSYLIVGRRILSYIVVRPQLIYLIADTSR